MDSPFFRCTKKNRYTRPLFLRSKIVGRFLELNSHLAEVDAVAGHKNMEMPRAHTSLLAESFVKKLRK